MTNKTECASNHFPGYSTELLDKAAVHNERVINLLEADGCTVETDPWIEQQAQLVEGGKGLSLKVITFLASEQERIEERKNQG